MSPLSRAECIELGISIPTVPLTVWAADQLVATRGREKRLEHRGIHPSYLDEIRGLIEAITEAQRTLGWGKGRPPPEVVEIQRIREEAVAYWQEAKRIIRIEFGSKPDLLVKLRLGVRTGRLIVNLTKELDCILSLLDLHAAPLGWRGVTETFRCVGEVLIRKLKAAQGKLDAVCKALPPVLAEQCRRKGRLYDLTRTLVRIGQLECLNEPDPSETFNYSVLRRELYAASSGGPKAARFAVR